MKFFYQVPIIEGYNFEVLVYPLEAKCPSCGHVAQYKGTEFEPCPNGTYNEGHTIFFHPISILRLGGRHNSAMAEREWREKCVECNYCKKLLKIGEEHDCPNKRQQ